MPVWQPPFTACSKEFIHGIPRRFSPFSRSRNSVLQHHPHKQLVVDANDQQLCCCSWYPMKPRRVVLLELCCKFTRRASPAEGKTSDRRLEIGRVENR